MAGECHCPTCLRFWAEYETCVRWLEENAPLPIFGTNDYSWYALEYARYLQRSINHHNGQQELRDGPQDGPQNMEQPQQQQMQSQYAQLQPSQAQMMPAVVPVNLMVNHQLLHAAENVVVDGNAHAAENVQGTGNPYNMPLLRYQHHHHHHHTPAIGQPPLGHYAASGPALAALSPPSRLNPAQLAPVTSQAAEQVRSNGQWRGQPPQGPPPGPAEAPKVLPTGTFIRALVAPGANRRLYMARCDQCIKQQDVCTAHYAWPCTRCKSSSCCSFGRPTNFVSVRIDPGGYNLGDGFTIREVSGRLEAPPHKLLDHLKQQQRNNPEY